MGVNGPGQDPLAGAAFAAKENARLAGRGPEGHIQRLTHGRFLRLQIGFGHNGPDLGLQLGDLGFQAAHAGDAVEDHAQLIGRKRLG